LRCAWSIPEGHADDPRCGEAVIPESWIATSYSERDSLSPCKERQMALPYKGPDNNRQDERNIPFGQIREQMWRFISVLLPNSRFHRGGTSIVVSTSRCGCKQRPRGPMFDSWVPHILFAGYNKRSMLFAPRRPHFCALEGLLRDLSTKRSAHLQNDV